MNRRETHVRLGWPPIVLWTIIASAMVVAGIFGYVLGVTA